MLSLYGQNSITLSSWKCQIWVNTNHKNIQNCDLKGEASKILRLAPDGAPRWARSEVKERMKKAKADKASAKAADVKKAGGKAAKNAPRGGKVVSGKR